MRLSPQTLARVAAVALVVVAAAVAAVRLGGGPAGEEKEVRVHPRPDDPLAADLLRCAELGRAAQDDWLCKRVWAENRQRFLTPGKPAAPGKPVEMFPSTPTWPKDQSRLQNGAAASPDQSRPSADRPKDE
ncbi:putative entry exclusion protein TrbK-alt [Tistrella mobilis]|uniref:putative entry exclusion protein TrbK-alt n=1 Tax=Tistrella mobilis TaxID=171437 RepID=UPI0006850A3C|nr:putative entry exclusion protein TrbK-alt [Tistrella mobilis]